MSDLPSIVVLESDPLRALDLEFLLRLAFAASVAITHCQNVHDAMAAVGRAGLLMMDDRLAPPGAADTLALIAACPGLSVWISDAAAPTGLGALWLRRPITAGDILNLARRMGTQRP